MPVDEHSRLIKAHAARRIGSGTTWNFDDLGRECDELVAAARSQANLLLAQARADAENLRNQAYAEGHAAGERLGFEASRDQIEARAAELAADETSRRLQTALPALETLAAKLHQERDRWVTSWETSVIRLSAAIAERIVRRELSRHPELSAELIRETLQLAAGSRQIKVHLNPADLETWRHAGESLQGWVSRVGEVQWIADNDVTPGGCLVESQQGLIDARIETQLERISAELVGSD